MAGYFEHTLDIRRTGSACLDLAYVAAGRFDGYFERNLKPWDMAAGILLVEESGGIVTDYRGDMVAVLKIVIFALDLLKFIRSSLKNPTLLDYLRI